mmetsp:Transcript_168063/g.534625  ORF Transcript_168063/g.534625 Transcript_168063/m.534625 type:complete len:314 (-) Transcript_168063:403-1344(-)
MAERGAIATADCIAALVGRLVAAAAGDAKRAVADLLVAGARAATHGGDFARLATDRLVRCILQVPPLGAEGLNTALSMLAEVAPRGHESAVIVLLNLAATNRDASVRLAALDALESVASVGDPRVRKVALHCATDEDDVVCDAALDLLERHCSQQGKEAEGLPTAPSVGPAGTNGAGDDCDGDGGDADGDHAAAASGSAGASGDEVGDESWDSEGDPPSLCQAPSDASEEQPDPESVIDEATPEMTVEKAPPVTEEPVPPSREESMWRGRAILQQAVVPIYDVHSELLFTDAMDNMFARRFVQSKASGSTTVG